MVVCKCRKATKLYCFVHKAPVCFDCICAPDHQHCVVWQYSDWVNDGDYDWPPHCAVCSESLEDSDKPTIRLSCLHVPHAECVKRHVESFPPNTAPAGFTCASPGCGLEIWPARSHKDSASALYTHLRALLAQTSVADVILSTPVTSDPAAASAQATALSDKSAPPAFASGPLAVVGRAADSASAGAEGEARGEAGGAVEERNGGEGEGSGAGSSAAAAAVAAAAAAAAAASAGAKRQVSGWSEGDYRSLFRPNPLSVLPLTLPPQPSLCPAAHSSAPTPSLSCRSLVTPQPQQQGGVNIARSRTGGSDRTAVDITEEIETAYRTDEEAGERKYARRGPAHLQVLRVLHALPGTRTSMHQRGRTHPCPSPTPPTSSGPAHLQVLRVLHALPGTRTSMHQRGRTHPCPSPTPPTSSGPAHLQVLRVLHALPGTRTSMHQRGRTHPCPSPTPPTSSGPPHLQFLRVLGSWWSPALHALPVTLTATHSHRRDKEEHAAVGAHEDGRRRAGQRRSGGVDPRKLLLIVAIV
ncbi:unnamed protein product [Closterium sp. Naga37s-1]|nr:unnamed protein product [Closterium sp. Naga37s-1]